MTLHSLLGRPDTSEEHIAFIFRVFQGYSGDECSMSRQNIGTHHTTYCRNTEEHSRNVLDYTLTCILLWGSGDRVLQS